MANKSKLDELVAAKMAAGLSKDDAIECAKRQIEHDEQLEAAEADEAAANKARSAAARKDKEKNKDPKSEGSTPAAE